jgi:Golgi phosphoprotein 3 (GPP34)
MRALPVADELFLVGHDEYSGKCLTNHAVLGCGLAGAVLIELMLAGRIVMADGRVVVRDSRPWSERVTDAALAEMLKRREAFPVRSWVEYLCPEVREIVGERLQTEGLVRREQSRGLSLRSVVRFPAVDAVEAAGPRVRLRYMLDQGQPLDLVTALLGALVRATELESVLLLQLGRQQLRDLLGRVVEALPPDLRTVIAAVDASVAAVALTVRR